MPVMDQVPEQLQKYTEYVTMLLVKHDVDGVNWSEDNRVNTATEALRSLQANYQKTNTKEQLLQQLDDARERGDDEAAAEYLRRERIFRSMISGSGLSPFPTMQRNRWDFPFITTAVRSVSSQM